MRKLYYNITITSISVIVALAVGSIEGLGLIADTLRLSGPSWDWVDELNENFGLVGYLVIGIFDVSWIDPGVIYRIRGYDELDVRSNPA